MNARLERDELFRLFDGLSDETLTEAEHARLEEILTGSAEARRLWFLYCDMVRGLVRRKSEVVVEASNVVALRKGLSRPGFRMPWVWAMAASLVFAVLIGALLVLPNASASPSAVIQRALKAHSAALDRCYRVEVRGESERIQVVAQDSRLWTRGDRFWNEVRAEGESFAWGRDEHGGVWFALSPREGGRLEPDEVPEALAESCELRSLQPESLLQRILADFDLRREPTSDDSYLIHAELKSGKTHPRYRSALLEVDTESGVLRRVVLHRLYQGRPLAVVTFTLISTSLNDDASYTLAGHVSPDAKIYDRSSWRGERALMMTELLKRLGGQIKAERATTTPPISR